MKNSEAPADLREGVRSGIVDALRRDTELRGPRTARRLLAAGALGIFGAVGVMLMISGHPYGHHPPWHAVLFAAIWSGFLVVAIALALLEVRTPSLPLARAACVGIVGLGIAGACSALCPDPHFLEWWASTSPGRQLESIGGVPLSVLCFGAVTTAVFGIGAAAGVLRGTAIRPLLPAAVLVALLSPGIALQSFGTSWSAFAAWMLGACAGAYAGIALGIAIRARPLSA